MTLSRSGTNSALFLRHVFESAFYRLTQESEDEVEEDEGERQVEGHEPPPHDQQRTDGNGEEEKSAFSRFARDSTRKSLSNNTMQKWLDAADRQDGGRMEVGLAVVT